MPFETQELAIIQHKSVEKFNQRRDTQPPKQITKSTYKSLVQKSSAAENYNGRFIYYMN